MSISIFFNTYVHGLNNTKYKVTKQSIFAKKKAASLKVNVTVWGPLSWHDNSVKNEVKTDRDSNRSIFDRHHNLLSE